MRLRAAIVAFFFLVVLVGAFTPRCSQAGTRLHVNAYDAHMQRASLRWLPEHDWRWLRAQCYQESRFNARAVSPAGARGLCQFMPGTWSDAQRALGVRDVYNPGQNAWAAGWYMRRQLNRWVWDRTDHQRLQLAQASYNAGFGHILHAQRLCGGARAWEQIAPCLHRVTGHHSQETIQYVKQIDRWYRMQVQ